MSSPKLQDILSAVNPAERIETFEQLYGIIAENASQTLIEAPFFRELPGILEQVKVDGIAGDFVQAGVWKGGSALYMHALNHALGMHRRLWLADTFYGFDPATVKHEKDLKALAAFSDFQGEPLSAQKVKDLFEVHGLLDESVHFLEGDVKDTLPGAGISEVSLLHIDVDFFEPTYNTLAELYDKVQPGGYIVIDDYGVPHFNCSDAVDRFRSERSIETPLNMMTHYIAWWRKEA